MAFGRCEFAAVFPQLCRDEIKANGLIKLGLIADHRDFRRGLLFCFRRGHGQRGQAILIQGPAAFERAVAHLDVVFLAAGEVIQGEGVFGRLDHAKIALNPGVQPHTGLGRALRNNRFDQRMGGEKLRDRLGFACGHDKIQIPHDLAPPPVTPGQVHLQRIRMIRQVTAQRLRMMRHLAQLK